MALKKKDYCRAAMYCVIAAIVLIIDTFSIYICCDVTDIIVYIITEINTFRCPLFFLVLLPSSKQSLLFSFLVTYGVVSGTSYYFTRRVKGVKLL